MVDLKNRFNFDQDPSDKPKGKIVEANTFILNDDEGNAKAALTTTDVGMPLLLFKDKHEIRFGITLDQDGFPEVLFADENGTPRIMLGVRDEQGSGPFVSILDQNGFRIGMFQPSESGPTMKIVDKDQKCRFVIGLNDKSGDIVLGVLDKNEDPKISLAIDENGNTSIRLPKDVDMGTIPEEDENP